MFNSLVDNPQTIIYITHNDFLTETKTCNISKYNVLRYTQFHNILIIIKNVFPNICNQGSIHPLISHSIHDQFFTTLLAEYAQYSSRYELLKNQFKRKSTFSTTIYFAQQIRLPRDSMLPRI
jgi:hypothetical protein